MGVDLTGIELVVFDADGTLRRTTVPGQPCPNGPGEWELIPDVRETVDGLRRERPDLRFGIASNQGGVGMGYMTERAARDLLGELAREAFGEPLPSPAVQLCPHRPSARCACRKPEPRMLESVAAHWGVDPAATLYVGDMEADRVAAERAGCRFAWAWDFFGRGAPESS